MPNSGPLKGADAPFASNYGNRVVYTDRCNVSGNIALNERVRLCRVPVGVLVDRVVIRNPDLDSGTTLVFRLGFEAIDGTVIVNSDIAVAAAGQTTWQAAATTTYEVMPPYLVLRDSWLTAVANAAGIGTGLINAKVEGEMIGPR